MFDVDELRISRTGFKSTIDDRVVILRVNSICVREFAVHETILRKDSAFFNTALDKKWREGRARHIDLPHDDPDVVGAYVHWLYFQKIASKPVSPPELPIDDGEYDFLARMYVFGEKVQADDFCDTVIDAMTLKTDDVANDGTRTFPSHSAITTLYNGTPPGSPGRRFVVAMYAEFGGEKWIPEEAELSHAEFLTDLVRAFFGRRPPASAHKQSNYPRRHQWHKRTQSTEFLQLASSREALRMSEAD